jgi:hypothetical protein
MVSTSAVTELVGVYLNQTLFAAPLFAALLVQLEGSAGSELEVVAPDVSSVVEKVFEPIDIGAEKLSFEGAGPVTVRRQPGGFMLVQAVPNGEFAATRFGLDEPPPGCGLFAVTKKMPPYWRQFPGIVAVI